MHNPKPRSYTVVAHVTRVVTVEVIASRRSEVTEDAILAAAGTDRAHAYLNRQPQISRTPS